MSSIMYGLGYVIETLLNMVQLLIFVSVFISWFNADPNNQLVRMVRTLTEPMYRPIRKYITGKIPGPLDLSPIVLIFIIIFLQKTFQHFFIQNFR